MSRAPAPAMQFRRNHQAPQVAAGRRRPTAYVVACFLLFLTTSPPSAGAGTTLVYDAFLSGAPVGTARLTLNRNESGYRIAGTASADGVAHLFSNWRSDFRAVGFFAAGRPELLSYAYDERERKKRRVLRLADGMVRQVKNGQVRAGHPELDGTDVLTAFFMDPGCWRDRLLHTGRYNYRIQGRPSTHPGGCDFEITDADGDRTRVHVRFGTLEGFRVPLRVNTRGLLRGSLRLRKPISAVQLAATPGR